MAKVIPCVRAKSRRWMWGSVGAAKWTCAHAFDACIQNGPCWSSGSGRRSVAVVGVNIRRAGRLMRWDLRVDINGDHTAGCSMETAGGSGATSTLHHHRHPFWASVSYAPRDSEFIIMACSCNFPSFALFLHQNIEGGRGQTAKTTGANSRPYRPSSQRERTVAERTQSMADFSGHSCLWPKQAATHRR